jgi:hypothetical protein
VIVFVLDKFVGLWVLDVVPFSLQDCLKIPSNTSLDFNVTKNPKQHIPIFWALLRKQILLIIG